MIDGHCMVQNLGLSCSYGVRNHWSVWARIAAGLGCMVCYSMAPLGLGCTGRTVAGCIDVDRIGGNPRECVADICNLVVAVAVFVGGALVGRFD